MSVSCFNSSTLSIGDLLGSAGGGLINVDMAACKGNDEMVVVDKSSFAQCFQIIKLAICLGFSEASAPVRHSGLM
jgi:hypothetical protein